jgi:hypothetical protein
MPLPNYFVRGYSRNEGTNDLPLRVSRSLTRDIAAYFPARLRNSPHSPAPLVCLPTQI